MGFYDRTYCTWKVTGDGAYQSSINEITPPPLANRTSTTDQAAGPAARERDLTAAGAERIFGEQTSSTAKRVKLAECLTFMREGDVLTVTKPDRLAQGPGNREQAAVLKIIYDENAAHVGLPGFGLNGPLIHTHPQW